MRPLKTLPAALALAGVLALSLPALAAPEGGEDDISAQIKAQMDKIIRLMEESEAALLEASTGGKADPKRVDVTVPPATGEAEGASSSSSGSKGSSGRASTKQLEELIKKQRGTGGQIPGELEELVRMVPQ